jgi:imidazole glycerol phosphate synthase glutamine amidotransferase subunit
MTRIAVIDHGAGNLVSIAEGLQRAGADVSVIENPAALAGADGIVLPGVGSASAAFSRLADAGFVEPIASAQVPLLGICVGLQLFFDGSDENSAPGLGLIPGRVQRLENAPSLPHIGWNDISFLRPDPLFQGIENGEVFYFVHSYAPVPSSRQTILATSEHGRPFVAAARSGTRVGVQFHPERSGLAGLRVLANFVAECREVSSAA